MSSAPMAICGYGSSRKLDELVSHLQKNYIQVFAVGIMMLQNVTEDER